MRVLIEKIGPADYIDLIVSENDIHKIKFGEMVTCETYFCGRKLYIGIYEIKELVYEKEDSEGEEKNREDNE